MAFNDQIIDWRQLIRITNEGLIIPDYAQLRKSVTQGFKSVYGSDIDTSTGTADGIYIDMYCLIINNIIQSFKTLYENLDVGTAQGKYLELLCTLSNVFRRAASKSSASINCTLDAGETANYEPEKGTGEFKVLDYNGLTWTHKKDPNNLLVFKPGVLQSVVVECDTYGPQEAPAGCITQIVDNSITMLIEQPVAAALGENEESDNELRARRNKSLNGAGLTTLESLRGKLLNTPSVRDVKIYNNNKTGAITALDGTVVKLHDTYICIRYANNVSDASIYDGVIGEIIYNRMTPGILTTQYAGSIDVAHSYNVPAVNGIASGKLPYKQIVYWKECKSVHPKITINLTKLDHYVDSTAVDIKVKLAEYLNNLNIGTDINCEALKYKVIYFDPQYRGNNTFMISSITVNDGTSEVASYSNKDTYYNYTKTKVAEIDEIEVKAV